MTKTLSVLLAALLAAGATPTTALAQVSDQVQALDRIAAVVDEDVILRSELDRALANIRAQYAGRENQLPPTQILERQVLERLVLVKLQVARANASGMRVGDDELNQALAAIAQQNGTDLQGLGQRLAADGISLPEFRQSIREEMTVQRLRQSFAQSRIVVSEGEVDAALSQASLNAVQYHLANILVGIPEGATAEQIATAQTKIDGIAELVSKGEMAFTAAAVRYSDAENALEGGDLGWRTMDEIPNAFTQLLKGRKPGDVIGPVRGPSGFQLLQLVDLRNTDGSGQGQKVTELNARHILVRITPDLDNDAALARIQTLRARIIGGADFQTVARESSDDANTRGQGGDLGWFPADAFGPDFGNQVQSVEDGGITAPFRTEAGWHIVQRVDTRLTDVTDNNRRNQMRETIGRRKLEEEFNRFVQELRGEAYVSLRLGTEGEEG